MSETVMNLPPTSFSSDGSTSGGTDAPQDSGPVQREATPQAPQRTESQQRSAAVVAEIRAKGASGKLSAEEMTRLQKHSLWRDGLTHLEPLENRATQAEDHSPADSVRMALQAESVPATRQEIDKAVMGAKVRGMDGKLANTFAGVAVDLQLDAAGMDTALKVLAKHTARVGEPADSDLAPLNAEETADFYDTASRLAGGAEKLSALSERARDYLQHVGKLEHFEAKGWTKSSAAFDIRLLNVLAGKANALNLPKGKR